MSKYNDTMLTIAGQSLASRAANGNAKFSITRAVGSKSDLSGKTDAELAALTALPEETQVAQIVAELDDPDGSAGVTGTQVTFQNKNESATIDEGYYLNTIGLYAKEDGSDKEILYALTTADEADYIPDYADNVFYKFTITIYVVVGQKTAVTVAIDVTGTASIDYVDKAVSEAVANIDLSGYSTLVGNNTFHGSNSFERPITMASKTVATVDDINNKVSSIDLTPYATSAALGREVDTAKSNSDKVLADAKTYTDTKIAGIPKPDLTPYATTEAVNELIANANSTLIGLINSSIKSALTDYIKVDPNTGYVDHNIKVHYGNLLIDSDVVGVNKWVLDEDTAIAQTAIYPANNYYVSDEEATS